MHRIVVVCLLALALTLGVAAGAGAEPPGWALPGAPKLGGVAQVGVTLGSDIGQLYCQPACTYTIEWLSCTGPSAGGADRPPGAPNDPNQRAPGCEIRWATPAPPTYTIGPEDQGRYVQFHVLAEQLDCVEIEGELDCTLYQTQAYSPTVGPIAPAPSRQSTTARPTNTAPPTISGQAEDLQTLTAQPGSWTGTAPIAFRYQWLRCGAAGECTPVAGSAGSSYRVRRADIGARISVTITALNPAGSTSATAAPTGRVVPARPRPGHDVLKASELARGDRLLIRSIEGPTVVRSRSGVLLRVTITDGRGFLIDGATVRAADSRGAILPAKDTSGARGTAFLEIRLGSRASAPSRVVVTITASKPGVKSLTATKRLVLRVVAL